MHKPIRKFGMEGIVGDDSNIVRVRQQFEAMVIKDMRALGYVPVLDLGPYWSTVYDAPKDEYAFKLSVYGVNVGRRRSWNVEGISLGKEILRTIPQIKSKPPSDKSE